MQMLEHRICIKMLSRLSDCREGNTDISIADALMSGFAVFSLKDPSLLAFDERREADERHGCQAYTVDRYETDRTVFDYWAGYLFLLKRGMAMSTTETSAGGLIIHLTNAGES